MAVSRENVYSPLLSIAPKQHVDGKRSSIPIFVPAAMTTLGEFSKPLFTMQERIVCSYKAKVKREGPRRDGQSPDSLTAAFRNRLRCELQTSVAKGFARQLVEAGLPRNCTRKAQQSHHY